GAAVLAARRRGARLDDVGECPVDRASKLATLRAPERAPHVQLIEEEHRSPPRREPRQRQPLVGPGEDAVTVRVAESVDAQVVSDGDDVAARVAGIGKAGHSNLSFVRAADGGSGAHTAKERQILSSFGLRINSASGGEEDRYHASFSSSPAASTTTGPPDRKS